MMPITLSFPAVSSQTLLPRAESSPNDRQLVRTDNRSQKLDPFLRPKEAEIDSDPMPQEPRLTSIHNLIAQFRKSSDTDVRKLLNEHTFVACVNDEFALIQHNTKLCIARTPTLSQEFFYQIMLCDFGNYGTIRLSEPTSLYELAMLGLEGKSPEEERESLSRKVTHLLCSKSQMLADYFSLEIDQEEKLCTLPLLLKGYLPQMTGLPLYLVRLATEVEWATEQECFDTFCRETARFYSNPSQDHFTVEHVLYPAFKRHLCPPSRFLSNGTILQLTQLSELYKVFERC